MLRRALLGLTAVLALACSPRTGAAPAGPTTVIAAAPAEPSLAEQFRALPDSGPIINPAWPLTGKARVATGASAMIAAPSPIAAELGREILQRGGNAVDAAVAIGFVLAVVHPEAGNIGGGGFMVIRMADGTVASIDYREKAPLAATPDMYLDRRGNPTDLSVLGHLAVGVPGAVAGMLDAHRRFGKLPLRDLIEPAVRLAQDGFIVDETRSRSIDNGRDRLYLFEASRAQFLPNGKAPAPGDRLRQPDLARTLAAIRDRGRDGFYRGWVADSFVAEMRRGGGIITHEDLAQYQAEWREPIRTEYRGHTIFSMPPASSGGVTLSLILNIVEGFEPLPRFGSPRLIHLEAEAMRRAFTDRNRYLGDPDFVEMPIARLTSKAHAAGLRAEIRDTATPTPPFDPGAPESPSTTHYSVVDAAGNAVSTTTTLNNSYGSAVTVRGAGFLLNDEMDDFASAPGKPNMYGLVQGEANAIAPGKRMLSAMTPSIVLDRNGQLLMVVGTPGGPRIITMVYHVISNVLDHGMALSDAVTAPRMHHQALPDQIRVERNGFHPLVLDSLRRMGHEVVEAGTSGDVEAILRVPAGWLGVSDPRLGGMPAGY